MPDRSKLAIRCLRSTNLLQPDCIRSHIVNCTHFEFCRDLEQLTQNCRMRSPSTSTEPRRGKCLRHLRVLWREVAITANRGHNHGLNKGRADNVRTFQNPILMG
jgi:hypothetical protein